MGVDDGMPPSFIPGPRSSAGVGMSLTNGNIRPTSFPATNTPPVPRISSRER
jgi:hypothetical protein